MIYIGEVKDNRDFHQAGKLMVKFPEFPEGKWIRGCSPTVGRDSGFFAIPQIDSKVVVTRLHSDSDGSKYEWIWLTGIWDPTFVPSTDLESDEDIKSSYGVPNAEANYAGTDAPQKFTFKTPGAHTFEMSDKNRVDTSDNKTPIQEDYIRFGTESGKKILIDDGVGKGHDRIFLGDGRERENFILIQSGEDTTGTQNSIRVECKNNMFLISDEGCIRIEVGEESEQDISVINDGKGSINITNLKAGNVNVSSVGEINLNSNTNININAKDVVKITGSRIDLN
jgi:hypothetical protein